MGDLYFLSKEIGGNWKRFARQFNIEDDKVDHIANTVIRHQDRCFKVFHELTRRDGSVKWKPIEMALQELGLMSTISNYLSWKKRTHESV